MSEGSEHAPWMCHVCDYKSRGERSVACSVCFKTTCEPHLQRISAYNEQTGLYEIQPVCVVCALAAVSG